VIRVYLEKKSTGLILNLMLSIKSSKKLGKSDLDSAKPGIQISLLF